MGMDPLEFLVFVFVGILIAAALCGIVYFANCQRQASICEEYGEEVGINTVYRGRSCFEVRGGEMILVPDEYWQ